ncbi:MAG: hypothetical protein HEP71_02870 [Roseivirga sp.]|nr:hypothetical protein [Roseivirga sp.]
MRFNLEQAIGDWKRSLRKHKSFEEGDLEELEDHFRNRLDEYQATGLSPKTAFEKVIASDYEDLDGLSDHFMEERKVSNSYPAMFRNFLKVGFRSIHKHSSYSTLNILGLVVGFACVFGIVVYLHQELSFDRFHEHGEDIYRVNLHMTRASGELNYPIIPPAFGPELKANFSEIKRVTRLRYNYATIIRHEQKSFFEDRVFFAEHDFLEMFSFPLKMGNIDGLLTEPNTVVITNQIAVKYFGTSSPMGKIINYNNEIDFKVVGVLEDLPENSHFEFDFLVSFISYKVGPGGLEPLTSWRWLGFLTYVQLEPLAVKEDLEVKAKALFEANNNSTSNRTVDVGLQPLFDIYLDSGDISNPQGGLFRINDAGNLRSLAIVAALIIIIAFFNYFNILTALMYTRTKEIGVRKILGSSRIRIINQMLTETCLLVFIAGVLSLLLVWTIASLEYLPALNAESMLWVLGLMLGLCASFGLINGIYIGSSLASQGVLSLLRSGLTTGKARFSIRKMILLFQYGISAALIMISLIVINQLEYFNQKDLGYDQDNILVAGFRGDNVESKKEVFRNLATANPGIDAVSFGPSLDGSSSGSPLRPVEWAEENVIQTSYFGVDYDFNKVIGLEILEGRFFDKKIASDSVNGLLINETLAEQLDFDNPLNRRVYFAGDQEFRIIGVFKDFHYQSMHHEIGPMALQMWLGPPRGVLVKYAEGVGDMEAVKSIATHWQETFPDGDFPFEYKMLTEQLDGLYAKEQDFAFLLKLFTGLAIFVAVMGMYGFSAVSAHQKIKQICIRRVLGAELAQISKVVGRDFLLLSLIASVLAIPVVYYLMNKWLEGFAYSISIGPWFFIIAVVIVAIVTSITLAIQLRRVMHVKPARLLRNE